MGPQQQRISRVDVDDRQIYFDASDPIYKVWCDCRLIPMFILVALVQLVLSISAFVFTIYQIVSIEVTHRRMHSHDEDRSGNSTRSEDTGELEITFFLCQRWYPLIYIRLFIVFCVIVCIFVIFYGLQTKNVLCVKIFVGCVFAFILLLLTYVALLSWHTIKYDDYFSFCFFGLTLLTMLLLNVAALRLAVLVYKFMKARRQFVEFVSERGWMKGREKDEESLTAASKHRRWFWQKLAAKYEIQAEVLQKASQELGITSDIHEQFRLCEIREESDEEDKN